MIPKRIDHRQPPSIQVVRAPILLVLAFFAFSTGADARQCFPHPPRLIDPVTFDQLLGAVKAEPFADGKLERISAVAGGRGYLFTSGQVVELLDAFTFWIDRLAALRLLPLIDYNHALAVLGYFDPAPATIRSEAKRVLDLGD